MSECPTETVGRESAGLPQNMGASDCLRSLSEPWPSGERVKTAIARAAKLSGLSYWRAFDIWYRKARRIEKIEIARISEALQKKKAEDARNELWGLRLRLERLEALLSKTDTQFHRETIDRVRTQVRRSR